MQGIPCRALATNGTAAARSLLCPLVIRTIWVAAFEGIKKNLPSHNLAFYFFIPCTIQQQFSSLSLPQPRCKSLQMPANLPFHFHVNCRSQQSYRRAYYAFPNVNLCSFKHQQKSHVYLKVGCNPLSALHLTADRMACPHEDFRKQ